jgi:hypothetical protein
VDLQTSPTCGTTVSYTLAGIHAVWDETTQPEPEIKKKDSIFQIKANEIGMDEWSEIQSWYYCGTVWTGFFPVRK